MPSFAGQQESASSLAQPPQPPPVIRKQHLLLPSARSHQKSTFSPPKLPAIKTQYLPLPSLPSQQESTSCLAQPPQTPPSHRKSTSSLAQLPQESKRFENNVSHNVNIFTNVKDACANCRRKYETVMVSKICFLGIVTCPIDLYDSGNTLCTGQCTITKHSHQCKTCYMTTRSGKLPGR